jgi:hypothetical protein
VEGGVVIVVVRTGGSIDSVWNDDQKDLAIGWARFLVGRRWHVAVVDAATLDATAVDDGLRQQALVKTHAKRSGLWLLGEEETP